MANRHRGEVEVELDGETHKLRFTLNALAEVEDRLNLASIADILETIKALSVRTLRTLLWAGLLHEQPELTEREVGEMDFDFSHAVERVSRALTLTFKTDEDTAGQGAAEGNARRPGRGAGTRH